MEITRKSVFQTGTDAVPSVDIGFSVDYSRMVGITFEIGDGARRYYIPKDWMMRLYNRFNGDAAQIDPNSAINFAKEFIVTEVLIANRFSYKFKSESKFGADFEAKMALQNAKNAGITFNFTDETKKTVEATIDGEKDYAIGFGVIRWHDLKP